MMSHAMSAANLRLYMQTNLSKTKWPLIALALALCWAFGSDDKHSGKIESKEPVPTFSHGTDNALSVVVFHPARYLSISCGKSWIEIDYKTGAVKLPKDVPLDEAAIQFWRAVADAFPEARRQIIEGERKQ